jgi:hypothetical protein
MKKLLMVLVMFAFFAAGYLTGSIREREAEALDLGGLTGTTGTIQSLKSLGKTIIEMQENVDRLQKNINEVKKVRDDVSNYQGIYDKVTGKPQQQLPQGVTPELQKSIPKLPGQ